MIINSLLQSYDQTGYNDASIICTTDAYGNKEWYQNGKRHREDGPAIEMANGSKEWFLNGRRHRTDGLAIEMANGNKLWHLNGQLIKTTQRKKP